MWRHPITNKLYQESTINLSVKNDTEYPVLLMQSGIDIRKKVEEYKRQSMFPSGQDYGKYNILVPPNEWKPYGLIDPEGDDTVEVQICTPLVGESSKKDGTIKVKLSKVGKPYSFKLSNNTHIKVQLKSTSNGKVISIETISADAASKLIQNDNKSFEDLRKNDFVLSVAVDNLGISIVAEKPTRRELFNLMLIKMSTELRLVRETLEENAGMLIKFSLEDMQMDNYSETAVYPVILRTNQAALNNNDGKGSKIPFIEFSLVTESPKDQSASIIRYVAFRMLELGVAVDSATILIYSSDLHSYFLNIDGSAAELGSNYNSQGNDQQMIAADFNSKLFRIISSNALYNIDKQYKSSQGQKLFMEKVVIHPMKAALNFYPSHYPRSRREIPPDLRWLTRLENITAVEDFQVRIKSFIAENAMESLPSLLERIGNKILRDLQHNLINIAGNLVGSLNLLGNPAGLYKNIGGGVQDFFYEVSGLSDLTSFVPLAESSLSSNSLIPFIASLTLG
jgi:hypothetical protein